jgi:two-component system chemotaxis sensor kinase CheA
VLRVRGRLVPVVPLARFLEIEREPALQESPRTSAEAGTVVLVRVDDHEFGLLVDGMRSGERGRDLLEAASITTVVVKPIGGLLAALGLYSGASVLGDGGVVLILDLRGVLRATRLPKVERNEQGRLPADAPALDRYLVCRTRSGRRLAVPLAAVVRLERYAATAIQPLGGNRVVRRGEGFTRIIDADDWLSASGRSDNRPNDSPPSRGLRTTPRVNASSTDPAAGGSVQLVVVEATQEEVALEVEGIVDVESAGSRLQPSLAGVGVAGSLALGGLATEVLDLSLSGDAPRSAGR